MQEALRTCPSGSKAGIDRNVAAVDRGAVLQREDGFTGVQGNRDHGADRMQLADGIRNQEG